MTVENTAETVLTDVDSTVLTVWVVIVVELVTVVIEIIELAEVEVLVDEVLLEAVCATCRVPDAGDVNSTATPTRNRTSVSRDVLPIVLRKSSDRLPY